jgi:branched-chain amino acid transport system ATP-binding protein
VPLRVNAPPIPLRPVPIIETNDLSRSFDGVHAVSGVSVSVGEGELRGVIGPNGAGKSTFFNLISGHLRPDAGTIAFRGRRIERLSALDRARLRISIVFQTARVFDGMTVLENVMVGAHVWSRHGFISAALRLPGQRAEERRIRSQATEAIKRVGLADWAGRQADALPLGQQRSLQVARALCGEPDLLLLDEPASGLRAGERDALGDLLSGLKDAGLTMMLIEHDVGFVSRLSDAITVLDLGAVIAEGPSGQVLRNPAVIRAYTGGEGADA